MTVSARRVWATVVGVVFALTPWVTIGLATPLAFGFATAVLRSRLLGLATAGYTAVVVTQFNLDYPEDQPLFGMCASVSFLVGGVHALIMSPRVIGRLTHGHDKPATGEAVKIIMEEERAALANDPALRRVLRQRERRRQAREILARDPMLATALEIGRPDRRPEFDDGGLVDVNRVPASVLAELPGFDPAMAERVISVREQLDGLRSGADLVVHADVPNEVVARLSEHLLFRPR